jgi:nucleoside-diphosphate-sugar epimerase
MRDGGLTILQVTKKNSLNAPATEGTGFIGIHLTETLIRKGVQARCPPPKTTDLQWLKGLPSEFVHGDFNDKTSETTASRRHRKADWL